MPSPSSSTPPDPEAPIPPAAPLAVAAPADLDSIPSAAATLDVEGESSSVPVAVARAVRGSSSREIDGRPPAPAAGATKRLARRGGGGKLALPLSILVALAVAATLRRALPDDDGADAARPPSELGRTAACRRPCAWRQIGGDLTGPGAPGDFFGATLRLGGTLRGSRFSVSAPLYGPSRGLALVYDIVEGDGERSFRRVGNAVVGERDGDMLRGIMTDDGYHLVTSSTGASEDGTPRLGRFGSFQISPRAERWEPYGNDMHGESADQFGAAAVNRNGTVVATSDVRHDSERGNEGVVDVYRFDRRTDSWARLGQRLEGTSKEEHWGRKVALSGDGYTVAIGSKDYNNSSGRVQVYRYDSGKFAWEEFGGVFTGNRTGENLGREVELSANGQILAITSDFGSSYSSDEITAENGLVRVFGYDATSHSWQQLGSDIESDLSYQSDFGYQLRTSDDGMRLAVSQAKYTVGSTDDDDLATPSAGRVRVYDYIEEKREWALVDDVVGQRNCDFVGAGFDLSPDGSRLIVGFPNAEGWGDKGPDCAKDDRGEPQLGIVRVYELLRKY